MSLKRRKVLKLVLIYSILAVAIVCSLFPFYWMVKSSLTPNELMYKPRPSLIPQAITFNHYIELFTKTKFATNLFNSLYVAGLTTVISLIIGVLGSYSMARLKYPGRRFLQKSIIISYLLPTAVLFIPMFVAVSSIGLNDNKNSLLLVYPTIIVPYCCYMLISYFKTIPYSLEESAMIDGCTRLQTMLRIIMPIATPGIAVVFTFAFTMAWNEYLYALVMTTSPAQQTVTVGISSFKFSDHAIWGLLMSSSVIASLPVVILYTVAQSVLVSGLTEGSVK